MKDTTSNNSSNHSSTNNIGKHRIDNPLSTFNNKQSHVPTFNIKNLKFGPSTFVVDNLDLYGVDEIKQEMNKSENVMKDIKKKMRN